MTVSSVEQMIGGTPLLEARRIMEEENLKARLLLKLERGNPGGSVKDRAALYMLDAAERSGRLQKGGTIIEPTSGNTGVGLCMLAAVRGYRAVIVMPETMSAERRMLMRAYGAQLVLTPGNLGMAGAIDKAKALEKEIPGSMVIGQFDNPANAQAHFETTGPEIFDQTGGSVDIFVAGVGTGGTITGVGRALRERKKDVRIVGVEPEDSPVLSGGKAGAHGLQGIGAGFVPSVLDVGVIDEILRVTTQEAYAGGRQLARSEGLLCGITSGAALHAAVTLARRRENEGKTIVALLPDTGERYLSTAMFDD